MIYIIVNATQNKEIYKKAALSRSPRKMTKESQNYRGGTAKVYNQPKSRNFKGKIRTAF